MRKIDFEPTDVKTGENSITFITDMKLEPRHIKQLNRELKWERGEKRVFKTLARLIIGILIVFPTVLLIILNADWIDRIFGHHWVQFGVFTVTLVIAIYLYLRWKLR